LRGDQQALDDQTGLDAVHVDHLPALEVPQVDGMGVLEPAVPNQRPQRVPREVRVVDVVTVRIVEIQQHRRNALAGHVADRYEQRAAVGVDDPVVEPE